MDKKEPQNIIVAVKYRIDANQAATRILNKSGAAARTYWNWQVERQSNRWLTHKERHEQWVEDGHEKHFKDLKEEMKNDLATDVYKEKSDEHKAVQKKIRRASFQMLDLAQGDREFRKLRSGEDKKFNWINETSSRIIGGQYKRLNTSYTEGRKKRKVLGFWKQGDFKKPLKGLPRFRSWRDNQYFDCEAHQIKWDWEKNRLRLPKCKTWIKFKQHIDMRKFLEEHPKAKLGMCTFTRTPTLKWHVFIPIDTGVPVPEKLDFDESNTVGIDVGIKNYITLSDPSKIDNLTFLKKFGLDYSDEKLSPYKADPKLTRRKKIRQRRLDRKRRINGKEFKSKNYEKQRLVCAKLDEKISNRRDDFTHELSRALVDMPFNAFAVEDLDIAGMKSKKDPIKGKDGKFKRNGQAQQRGLNRQISNVAWGSFFTKFQYKTEYSGKHMIRIDRFEPTSKKCGCGYIYNDLKLSQRVWECPECGVVNDRDKLAATNIKNYVLGGKND